ncbi:MAG: hypothetical protein A2945_03055 [Candidatus Liptonbacteria bacterium RIFCSPLOWO2_01_FULL_52_25]|uniref:Uncharacterized protein n=1 Tax=Candidatus Liptonbacteria bacterium RIFCSPLOWO2_01_FULL_52_25 TaxID=1798650 RepID=A0A1G2CFS9_9BACT|nr:MAG: hypothetical protein A2945_03055 [Candidatus Liptonbacteria bacterium RIFCSPLOWO2_01_FULL_52_25]
MEGKIPSQNLIRQINPEAPKVDPGLYRALTVDALGVLAALGVGYVYQGFLGGSFGIAILLGAVGLYGTFTALQAFLNKGVSHRLLVLLLEVVALLALFYKTDIRLLGAGAVVLFALLAWGDVNGRRTLDNGLRIHFFKVAFPVLKKFVTAMAIVLVLLYVPQWDQNRLFISENSFQVFYDWASGLVNKIYPTVNVTSSFGNLVESVARLQLQDDATFKALPPASQGAALKQVADELTKALGEWMGITISATDLTSGVMYKFITGKIAGLRTDLGNWFLFAWGVILFFVVRGFGLPFYLVISVFVFIVYQILLASGFIHITGESRTHEAISY